MMAYYHKYTKNYNKYNDIIFIVLLYLSVFPLSEGSLGLTGDFVDTSGAKGYAIPTDYYSEPYVFTIAHIPDLLFRPGSGAYGSEPRPFAPDLSTFHLCPGLLPPTAAPAHDCHTLGSC